MSLPVPQGTRVHVFDDAAALAAAAAQAIASRIAEGIAQRGGFDLALSGGRTPAAAYRALASAPGIAWARVRIWFADERAVPPDDPESNFRMAREALIDPARIPPPNVHRMRAEHADLDAVAIEVEARFPAALDGLVLGMGEDGHTCSLFPGSPLLGERVRRIAAVGDSPKPPPRRLTVTPRVLAEARAMWMIATGAAKAAMVARALDPATEPRIVPAALARAAEWYVDRAAAAAIAPR